MVRYIFTFSIILLAALSRLLPHPDNFVPINALALFGGAYLDKKHAFVVPIAAMLISDYFIGFYSEIIWVYASFIVIGFIGLWLKKNNSIGKTLGATVAGSVLFFIVTNFGVWASSLITYSHNLNGLIQCYVAAIPFFRNSLAGDIVYVGIMFGLYELARKYITAIKEPQTV